MWSCKGSILYPKETVVSVFLCLIEYNLQLYIIGCYLLWAFLLFTFSALSFTRVYFALAWPRFWKQRLQRVYDKFSYITLSRLFKVDSSKLMNVSKDCFGFKVGKLPNPRYPLQHPLERSAPHLHHLGCQPCTATPCQLCLWQAVAALVAGFMLWPKCPRPR